MSATVRDHLKVCAFAIALLSLVSQGLAATYYVDYAAGSDLNAGDSTSAPWRHCPGDTALISSADTTFVTASNYITSSSGSSVTWNLTLQTNSFHAYLMVAVAHQYCCGATNVIWAGTNLTLIGQQVASDGQSSVELFGTPIGATMAGTYAVTVQMANSRNFAGSAMLFEGVNQSNPLGVTTNTTSASATIVVPPNGYGVAALGTYLGGQGATFGSTLAYQNSSGVRLSVASSTRTGVQTFGFSLGGYPGAMVAVPLLLDTVPGPGSTQLSPGDTVKFKGGVSYILTGIIGTGGILVSQSGTATSPVTYDGNYDGAWGTGKALITDNFGTNNRIAFHYAYGQGSNTVIRNFDIGQMGGAATLPADPGGTNYAPNGLPSNYAAGVIADVGFQHVTIADCYFHELGYWQNFKPVGNGSIGGHGIRTAGANGSYAVETDGLTITNCEFTKIRQPIQINCFKSVVNVNIVGCYVHEFTEWCMDLALQNGSYMDNVSVHDCRFLDWDKFYSNEYWKAYDYAPHQNGIYFRGDVIWCIPSTNVNFYNNTYRSSGSWSGGTSGQYVEGPLQCNIYNNVFDNVHPANAAIVLQGYLGAATNVQVRMLNNTFYVPGTAIYFTTDDGDTEQNNIVSQNNIFVNPMQGVSYNYLLSFNSRSTNSWLNYVVPQTHMDYNSYEIYNASLPLDLIGTHAYFGVSGGYWLTLEALRSYGWDTHSFTNAATFVNVSAGDYHLQAGSPQIDAGLNLSSLNLPGLNQDKDGNSRPPFGPWTLGAYAPIGSSGFPFVSLVASTNTIINGQSVLLTWASINATNVFLTGVGQVVPSGSLMVSPTLKTTYVITATGTNGTQSASAAITVRPSPPILIPLH